MKLLSSALAPGIGLAGPNFSVPYSVVRSVLRSEVRSRLRR
jgi:hypothetical protein